MTRINVKPGPTASARKAKARKDAAHAKRIRDKVADRDMEVGCRAWGECLGVCEGKSEWAHLGERQRFKTRGLPPEVRHTTAASCLLCTKHHDLYDDGKIDYFCHTDNGADGPMTWGFVEFRSVR